MEIREIREDSEDLSILEAINEEAIPEIERCALSDMLATGAKVWCIDSGKTCVQKESEAELSGN